MSYFMQFWTILGPYDPFKCPWYYQQSTLNGSYYPKILHKIVLPENRVISIFFDVKMTEKCLNVIFHAIWPILGPYGPLKGPLHYQWCSLMGSYSFKILQKILLPENGFISIFLEWKFSKSAQNVILHAILAHFGTIWPTQKPLYYQQSTLQGSYSPKILHKIVLPENGFISIFLEAKMFKKCPKCNISCNFGKFWDHMTHSKALHSNNKVHWMAHVLPIVFIN